MLGSLRFVKSLQFHVLEPAPTRTHAILVAITTAIALSLAIAMTTSVAMSNHGDHIGVRSAM